MSLEINKIYNMDCLEGMRQMDDESVDLVVTDPPYGLKFMGKDWDRAIPPVAVWEECLRVLKPGAFAFIMSSPRQDVLSRMIVNLEDAGFEMGFTSIYWTYASGFPKAMNISKMCDKKKTSDNIEVIRRFLREKLKGVNRKKIAKICEVTERQIDHWIKKNESQPQIPSLEKWNILKEHFDIGSKRDREINWTNLGKIIGEIENPISMMGCWKGDKLLRTPATPQAKALDGSYGGFQPKPAVEVVIVCMKPLSERTYVDQALKNGKGITWLDEGRIPYESEGDASDAGKHSCFKPQNTIYQTGLKPRGDDRFGHIGRFPANLLVSDDVLNDGKTTQSGQNCTRRQKGMFVEHTLGGEGIEQVSYPDSGSFSRYFDLDAWAVEKGVKDTFPFMIVPKASKSEKNAGCEDLEYKTMGQSAKNRVWSDKCANCGLKFIGGEPRCHCNKKVTSKEKGYQYKNNHPTVKPVKLIAYLITLGSREGDVILDTYIGSGTTPVACIKTNRNYIGFENDTEMGYFEMAEKRIAHEKRHKGFF